MAAGMTIAGTSGREHGSESKRSFRKRRRATRATLEHWTAPSCARAVFVFQLTRLMANWFCKPNCKPTTRHRTVSGITRRHRQRKIGEPEHTLSYCAERNGIRILELENRCTGNRTPGVRIPPSPPASRLTGPPNSRTENLAPTRRHHSPKFVLYGRLQRLCLV
jgi:hypothetical protein